MTPWQMKCVHHYVMLLCTNPTASPLIQLSQRLTVQLLIGARRASLKLPRGKKKKKIIDRNVICLRTAQQDLLHGLDPGAITLLLRKSSGWHLLENTGSARWALDGTETSWWCQLGPGWGHELTNLHTTAIWYGEKTKRGWDWAARHRAAVDRHGWKRDKVSSASAVCWCILMYAVDSWTLDLLRSWFP